MQHLSDLKRAKHLANLGAAFLSQLVRDVLDWFSFTYWVDHNGRGQRRTVSMFRPILLAAAALSAPPVTARVADQIKMVSLPPSREQGLDMVLVDMETMPQEPELAGDLAEAHEERWSGQPVDLLKPVHHLYTDFRRQLVRYQMKWSSLPQVRVPGTGAAIGRGSTDLRLPILRERLGLSPNGGFDETLQKQLIAYQHAHGLKSDGIAGAGTLRSLNRGAAYYERLILLNMERARRLPTTGKYVLVDAGSARLWMYENGRPVDDMKVIVGTTVSETPMMAALIRYASVNPYWNVPPDLVEKLIAPRVLSEGTAYLTARGYEVLESWEQDAKVISPDRINWRAVSYGREEIRVRQLPGAGNSMGEIKFMMPNDFGIYLHDTPNKALFAQEDRWLSNGCVRVEDARRLARWIFGDMPTSNDKSRETRVDLAEPVPVYITYLTAGSEKGSLAFRPDPYQLDDSLLARFDAQGDGMIDAQDVALATAPSNAPTAATVTRSTASPTPAKSPNAPKVIISSAEAKAVAKPIRSIGKVTASAAVPVPSPANGASKAKPSTEIAGISKTGSKPNSTKATSASATTAKVQAPKTSTGKQVDKAPPAAASSSDKKAAPTVPSAKKVPSESKAGTR